MWALMLGIDPHGDANMAEQSNQARPEQLPGTFKEFVERFPALGQAHEQIGMAVEASGPLDRRTCELIKIGLSIGAGLESATRSHVRRAMQHGVSEAEIEQAVLLSYNTCGWPRMVMAWRWVREQFARGI
jgi:alkylhydroperoxidase/carboxymuconolactone decarboxylase family protein YurZ